MPDLMTMLRLKNLFGAPPIGNDLPQDGGIMGQMPTEMGGFGPQPDPFGNISFGPATQQALPAQTPMAPVQTQPTGGFDVGARMRELYQPETVAQDRFNSMLGEYPEAQKPGWLRVIGASLADLARPGSGMSVIEGNRGRKVADWKNKIGAAQDAASLERGTNVNERQLAGTIATQERLSAADQARAEKDAARTKIMQDRAEVYRLKSQAKNLKFNFSGPKVIVTDPATGEVKQTDIDTGSLSDADKMAVSQEDALERITTQGGETRKTEELRQTGREGLAETRGWTAFNTADGKTILVNQITGETKPITGVEGTLVKPGTNTNTGRGELPTQTKVRQATAAREFAARNPELGKFIQFSPGNEFSIRPPASGWSSGPTAEQYAKITKAIYGDDIPVSPVTSRTGATPSTGAPKIIRQRSPSTGKIRESSDGGKTWRIVN